MKISQQLLQQPSELACLATLLATLVAPGQMTCAS
jgi:hypothetical protein